MQETAHTPSSHSDSPLPWPLIDHFLYCQLQLSLNPKHFSLPQPHSPISSSFRPFLDLSSAVYFIFQAPTKHLLHTGSLLRPLEICFSRVPAQASLGEKCKGKVRRHLGLQEEHSSVTSHRSFRPTLPTLQGVRILRRKIWLLTLICLSKFSIICLTVCFKVLVSRFLTLMCYPSLRTFLGSAAPTRHSKTEATSSQSRTAAQTVSAGPLSSDLLRFKKKGSGKLGAPADPVGAAKGGRVSSFQRMNQGSSS